MKKLTFLAITATCLMGAGGAMAQSELICVKPTPGAPALCGVISSYTVQPQTFDGWVSIPSGGQDMILNRIDDDCSTKFLDWNEYASKGETIRTHISCFFDEEAS